MLFVRSTCKLLGTAYQSGCRLVYRSRYFWSVSALCVNRCLADIERVIRLMAARLDCYSHHRLSLIAMMVMRSLAPCADSDRTTSSNHCVLKSLRPQVTSSSSHCVLPLLCSPVTSSPNHCVLKSLHRSHSIEVTLSSRFFVPKPLRPQTTSSPNTPLPHHTVLTSFRPETIASIRHTVPTSNFISRT